MTQVGYLVVSIATLVALGGLALALYLSLRKGPKPERKKCVGCEDLSCPIAKALEEKE